MKVDKSKDNKNVATKKPEPDNWQHDHSFGMERRVPAERRTLIVVVLTALATALEIAGGLVFGSMALLANGIHMALHVVVLGIGVLVYVCARRYAGDPRLSFGSGKLNALGGYSNATLLAVFSLLIGYESLERLVEPVAIDFDFAIAVAVVGAIIYGISLVILNVGQMHEYHHVPDESGPTACDTPCLSVLHQEYGDHNLRAAIFHVLADVVISVLTILALVVGKYLGAVWLDPAMGLIGAAVVLWWAQGLIRLSGGVLLDRRGPEWLHEAISERIEKSGEARIADLHVWSIGPNLFAAELVVFSSEPVPAETYHGMLADLGLAHLVVEPRRSGP
ncbi:MAG: CDF family Co(II)/Ni(II) efflux transporter DmeF [Alphaproteobacteria bacterium]|nr:CDF family Co(II)/Ni(II) efflux transporter DmeF [Alphaproteobacteria bacterium]